MADEKLSSTFQEGLRQGRAIAAERADVFAKDRNFLLSLNGEVVAVLEPLVASVKGMAIRNSKHSIGTEITLNSATVATVNPVSTKSEKFRVWWSDPKMARIAGLHYEDEVIEDTEKLLLVVGKYLGLVVSGAVVDPGNAL